jgi:hypothetical protein
MIRSLTPGSVRLTVPDVAATAQLGADVVLNVAGQVEDQGAGGIADAGKGAPYRGVVRIGLHLPRQRAKLASHDGLQVGGLHALPLPGFNLGSRPLALRLVC